MHPFSVVVDERPSQAGHTLPLLGREASLRLEAHRLLSAGGLCRGVTRTLPVQSCEARSCIGH